MKKIFKLSALIVAMCLGKATFAQLQDEQDVTMTMDLQPILQLQMEGPDQIDFTFDEINKYYTGVIKTGANILKVSASVSFDLWAVGLSSGSLVAGGLVWDNPVIYGDAISGNAKNLIPLTALELHQFPANPVTGGCALNFTSVASDYSAQFAPYFSTNLVAPFGNSLGANLTNGAGTEGNNAIFCTSTTTPYVHPASTALATTTEKYIAGASTTAAGCQVNAGSYLFGTNTAANNAAGTFGNASASQTSGGYYFVMDYRILPGLPAKFPSTVPGNNANGTGPNYITLANAAGNINTTVNDFAAPGVYTMFVKYIVCEDE